MESTEKRRHFRLRGDGKSGIEFRAHLYSLRGGRMPVDDLLPPSATWLPAVVFPGVPTTPAPDPSTALQPLDLRHLGTVIRRLAQSTVPSTAPLEHVRVLLTTPASSRDYDAREAVRVLAL